MRSRAIVSSESGSASTRPCHSQRPRLCWPSVSPGREAGSHPASRNSVTQSRLATTLHKTLARRREQGTVFTGILSYPQAWHCVPMRRGCKSTGRRGTVTEFRRFLLYARGSGGGGHEDLGKRAAESGKRAAEVRPPC